jgi:hypothetical protein
MSNEPFSSRHGYRNQPREILIREEAPENLRFFVLETARDLEFGPSSLRSVLCKILRVPPDRSNWSEYPNIWAEVQELMHECEWFQVYDIIEAVYSSMRRNDSIAASKFAAAINGFFLEEGIGWQLDNDGELITRGAEAFESVVTNAMGALEDADRPTAARHIHEALEDLSRRPAADLPGAMYHAMGALEAVARGVTADAKSTFGEILKRHPEIVPKPLDTALSQVWGFASNEARHVVEGRDPHRREAELIVGLAAVVATYLSREGSS